MPIYKLFMRYRPLGMRCHDRAALDVWRSATRSQPSWGGPSPLCGSHKLTPLRAFDPEEPAEEWEWPACTKCDWMGEPVRIAKAAKEPAQASNGGPPEGDCLLHSRRFAS
jgi:hypothetical protein